MWNNPQVQATQENAAKMETYTTAVKVERANLDNELELIGSADILSI